jgi:hypothetical protein
MTLPWNDIRARAGSFALEWSDERRERAEAQTFWNDFFGIFGISRRRLAAFEVPARRLREGGRGNIDLFWPGVMIVEHKSRGQNLDRAYEQAIDYVGGIADDDLPRYVLVSDFGRFRLYDLDAGSHQEFELGDLPRHVRRFAFMLGQRPREQREEDPVNVRAAELMGRLHDVLDRDGYNGHALEVFLVRTMFCLFADDTGIIQPKGHFLYLLQQSKLDGSDLGTRLASIFQVLNQPEANRSTHLDEDLARLPYVNGGLFAAAVPFPTFTEETRDILLKCAGFDWNGVSPAVFGAMFQTVMDTQAKGRRRDLGAHYTSERNILKLIRPLFLDDLRERFDAAKRHPQALRELLKYIRTMRFFDPACGCGNFLVIAYREVRQVEIEIYARLAELEPDHRQEVLDAGYVGIDVDALFGIEIEEFPARVAETAIYLMDHLMNLRLSELVGQYLPRLPLRTSPTIRHGNALELEWTEICPRERSVIVNHRPVTQPWPIFLLGNPPFIGKKRRNQAQKDDLARVCGKIDGNGELDYVCAWYVKAAEYITDTPIHGGFVSTNSIAQGEQVGILWRHLLSRGISIRFAHRTFRWSNEARGNANVYVVIIGFAHGAPPRGAKLPLFDYDTPDAETPLAVDAGHINPYLISHADDTLLAERRTPLCSVPRIVFGNMPNDAGHLLLTDQEKHALVAAEPRSEAFIKPFLSADELINGERRWCIWLKDASPVSWRAVPVIRERVDAVKSYRSASTREATKRLADTPYLFGEIRQPASDYLIIPRHSSEHRRFIPMAMATAAEIAADSCVIVPGATRYHFGVLMSDMHMAWVRHVCGRLESRYRYSNTIVYNNFPWPDADQEQQHRVSEAAEETLAVRARHLEVPGTSLATIYDPNAMPADLVAAHRELSRAVDRAYGTRRSLANDRDRMEFLLERYAALTTQTAAPAPPSRRRSRP